MLEKSVIMGDFMNMKKFIKIVIIILIIIGCGLFIETRFTTKNNNQNEKIDSSDNQTESENILETAIISNDVSKTKQEENIIVDENSNSQNNVDSEIATQNNTINTEKEKGMETDKNDKNRAIKEKLSPSGFMGSSLIKVAIYSNGEVYLLKYDGEGYEDSNIIAKELIATNASSIYSKGSGEDFEAIVVKGSASMQVKSNNYPWIEFEK